MRLIIPRRMGEGRDLNAETLGLASFLNESMIDAEHDWHDGERSGIARCLDRSKSTQVPISTFRIHT